MIRPKGFDHISFALPSFLSAVPFFISALGGRNYKGGRGSAEFRGGQWRFAKDSTLEIIEPVGPSGFLHKFLAKSGPGVHHITFIIPDILRGLTAAKSLGYEVVGFSDEKKWWKEAFITPKQAGIVLQLAEHNPDEVKAAKARGEEVWSAEWEGFQHSVVAEAQRNCVVPPAQIVGLRMNTISPAAAVKQFCDLLDAKVTERRKSQSTGGGGVSHGSELIFRWPDSAMRIVVDPGSLLPYIIEVAGVSPNIKLPTEFDPVFRTRFSVVPQEEL